MNNYTFCLGIKQCKFCLGDFERFPLQKKCSVWVGNSSSTLVDKGGYDPRGKLRSQILRFLSAWTLSNATIVVCLRGCPVMGFVFQEGEWNRLRFFESIA